MSQVPGPEDIPDDALPERNSTSVARDMLKRIVTLVVFAVLVSIAALFPLIPLFVLYFFGFEMAVIAGLVTITISNWFDFSSGEE